MLHQTANWEKEYSEIGVVVIEHLRHKYILGQVLHRSYQFSTSYSTTGKHYITINGRVTASQFHKP